MIMANPILTLQSSFFLLQELQEKPKQLIEVNMGGGLETALEKGFPRDPNHLLRMVVEPKYFAEEVIGHPNHHLRI